MPGGSGHVGQAIRRRLEPLGYKFVILTRSPQSAEDVAWDGATVGDWAKHLEGADVVINLAGRSVNCRYTSANLSQMKSSRVDSVRVIGQAISQSRQPPRLWLQSSTATIYSHRFDAPNDDVTGVLGWDQTDVPRKWIASIQIAKEWEEGLERAETPHTRKVAMRSAMTMSVDRGSVFDAFATLARRGLGGTAGKGDQYVSWVHEADFVNAIRFLIDREDLSGPVNICSPNPLPNREFMRVLREAVHAPFALPTPAWLLEIGAFYMQTETELILKSRRVVPTRLLQAGFEFEWPDWTKAAKELASRWKTGVR